VTPAPCASATADSAGDAAAATASGDPAATVNRLLSLLIYAILFFMGTSLAFLDNLGTNLLIVPSAAPE
jgi:hypothetical protein